MRTVNFRRFLTDDDFIRVSFVTDKGKIQEFVIQLESRLGDDWHPIVRYDCAHGFAHRDLLRPRKSAEKKLLEETDLNRALTFAQKDITTNWQTYRRRFEKWLNEK